MISHRLVPTLLTSTLLVGSLCLGACGSSNTTTGDGSTTQTAEQTSESSQQEEATYEIETDCGNLTYPEAWEDQLHTTVTDTDAGCDVSFDTSLDGTDYHLFTVQIGGEGDVLGTITDSNGNTRNVTVDVPDLGDLSSLSQEQQDQLYSMQEGINTIVEHLDPAE